MGIRWQVHKSSTCIKTKSRCRRQSDRLYYTSSTNLPDSGPQLETRGRRRGGSALQLPPCWVISSWPSTKASSFPCGYCPQVSSSRGEVKSPSLLLSLIFLNTAHLFVIFINFSQFLCFIEKVT